MPLLSHSLRALPFVVTTLPLLALDLDGNGLDDVWEARYAASGLVPSADADGDGQSNLAESQAGTDPFDAASRFNADVQVSPGQVKVTLPAQPGKQYQLTTSATLAGSWTPVGSPVLATTATVEFTVSAASKGFFQATAVDVDSDGDGLNDWSELQLSGFDRLSGQSFSGTGNDLAVATEMIQMLRNGDIALTTTAAAAYEKENTPAVLTFDRPLAKSYPFTLFLKTSGSTDPTKSSASATDYTLADGTNAAVAARLVIPARQTTAILNIKPVVDTKAEVPERLHVALGGSSRAGDVTVCDAANTAANQKLLIAYLRAVPGVTSLGTGLATVRLQGDNDLGTVAVSFSNLNSAVNSTQVLNAGNAILQSVPPANYGGQTWMIRASQSFTTDQAVLDALLAGGVKLGVFTQANVTGEIEGQFQPTNASSEFQPPPNPDPIATLTGTALDRDISRFLLQATFGPTPEAIADMQARVAAKSGDRIAAYGEWIDEQLRLPPVSPATTPVGTPSPSLELYTIAANQQDIQIRAALPTDDPNYNAAYDPNNNNRRRGWWLFALSGKDQLRQRMGFALGEIFVISDTDSLIQDRSYGSANYHDMLCSRGTTTYRNLLEGVATHPMMGWYLSHLRNQKAVVTNGVVVVSPDENFAREIMQLFSIGLVKLHPDGSLKLGSDGLPIPTYGQTDITEMARVFTGWSFSRYNNPSTSDTVVTNTSFNRGNGSERYESQWTAPMAMFSAYHDVAAKSMIGLSLPANQTGEKDLAEVLDYLAANTNTPPFICRRLIQRFTTANPSSGYLYRVSEKFRTTGGDLKETVKAILLDPEVRSPDQPLALASAGKIREPLLRATALLRAFGGKSAVPIADLINYTYPQTEIDKFPAGTMQARISSTTGALLQNPMSAPTVFNFFLPDYTPAGTLAANGLVSPEMQIANENTVIQAHNYLYSPIYGSLSASNLPNQTTANLNIDVTPLNALYMAVVDKNGDGQFTNLDTGAFNNAATIKLACASVLDRVDYLLCAGALKASYGDTPGKTRMLILDGAASIQSQNNNSNSASNQATYMRDRIRAILWLVSTSPECVTLK
ncbi:DUF1800 family protein [Luteolibacter sp. LG18]|uniref:DUF1800 family protein n=1 Tax=Luteolibacter sp. LG18 TaxID=2819286 RepID=UPI002B287CC2|nr:hypothetical protein llg_15480 [Luteolibacter sp. LG18]